MLLLWHSLYLLVLSSSEWPVSGRVFWGDLFWYRSLCIVHPRLYTHLLAARKRTFVTFPLFLFQLLTARTLWQPMSFAWKSFGFQADLCSLVAYADPQFLFYIWFYILYAFVCVCTGERYAHRCYTQLFGGLGKEKEV